MGAYPGNGLANLIGNNRQVYLWDQSTVPVNTSPGSLSQAVQVARLDNASYPWGLSFECWFSGDPGAFEIDIMGANVDIGYPTPGHYIQLGSITAVNSAFVGRWDMPSYIWPRYIAGYLKTLTNSSVLVTLQATK